MNGFCSSPVRLYSLLFIDSPSEIPVNGFLGGLDPREAYVRCGARLFESCKAVGQEFSIITNNPDFVEFALSRIGSKCPVLCLDFHREIPQGILFRIAHFKLDVFRAFASGDFGERVGLLDLDMVQLASLDMSDVRKLEDFDFVVYDLTEIERASYGREVVNGSFRIVDPSLVSSKWFGGEFIIGSVSAFSALSEIIDEYWHNYLENLGTLHHSGDEMIVSCALNKLIDRGFLVADHLALAEDGDWVVRWWSIPTRSKQISLRRAFVAKFLHLPADKGFLSRLDNSVFRVGHFRFMYLIFFLLRQPRNLLSFFHKLLFGSNSVFLPRF